MRVNEERPPFAQLIGIAWMSSLYQPGGTRPFVSDDFPGDAGYGRQVSSDEEAGDVAGDDPSYLGRDDVRNDPAWRGWLDAHLSRDDISVNIQVEDIPKAKVTSSFSKKQQQHRVTYWLPVQDFLVEGSDERSVVRGAVCELYRAVARRLDLPDPPASL